MQRDESRQFLQNDARAAPHGLPESNHDARRAGNGRMERAAPHRGGLRIRPLRCGPPHGGPGRLP